MAKGTRRYLWCLLIDRLFGTYLSPENFDIEKSKNRLDDESVTIKTIVGV